MFHDSEYSTFWSKVRSNRARPAGTIWSRINTLRSSKRTLPDEDIDVDIQAEDYNDLNGDVQAEGGNGAGNLTTKIRIQSSAITQHDNRYLQLFKRSRVFVPAQPKIRIKSSAITQHDNRYLLLFKRSRTFVPTKPMMRIKTSAIKQHGNRYLQLFKRSRLLEMNGSTTQLRCPVDEPIHDTHDQQLIHDTKPGWLNGRGSLRYPFDKSLPYHYSCL
jgi:hypothetical protein